MKIHIMTAILTVAVSATLADAGESPKDLLAGNDFSEWSMVNGQPVGDGWTITGGEVMCKGNHSGDIITKEHYRNFDLRFEWKISKGANSGIKYRTREKLGLEYQLLDDENHVDGAKQNHRVGSLYDILAAPDDKTVKPVGKWNTGRILVDGNHIEHWLNGQKLLEIEIGTVDWEERFAASKYNKYEGFGTWTGPILLQDHGDKVWFRNIRIKRL